MAGAASLTAEARANSRSANSADTSAPTRRVCFACLAGARVTWEAGIHRYLKRATLNRALFGSPTQLRRELAQYRA